MRHKMPKLLGEGTQVTSESGERTVEFLLGVYLSQDIQQKEKKYMSLLLHQAVLHQAGTNCNLSRDRKIRG